MSADNPEVPPATPVPGSVPKLPQTIFNMETDHLVDRPPRSESWMPTIVILLVIAMVAVGTYIALSSSSHKNQAAGLFLAVAGAFIGGLAARA